jgi:uncharacterized protein YbjT (DUF2867 family)
LVDAARRAGLGRFVFTSILTCDKAPGEPHFWCKKLIEDHLEPSGVPFMSLRPGAFVGAQDFWARIGVPVLRVHRPGPMGRSSLSPAQGDVVTALRDAEPEHKLDVYRNLGLRLTYDADTRTVIPKP